MCPICGSPGRRLFRKEAHQLLRCRSCRHRWAEAPRRRDHVESVYADSYFEDGGAGYPGYLDEGGLLRSHGRRYARILADHARPGTVLDVGAAAGFILRGFLDEGWRGEGIEPNASMCAHAREALGVTVRVGTLEEMPGGGDGGSPFDLVCMIQVVGHFLDPHRALERAAALTRPGGHWLIETWDPTSLSARLFGRHWHAYNPPSVLHWFTPRSLARLAAELGLEVVARGRPAKRLSGAHAKSILRHRLGRRLGRIFDVIPDGARLPYPAEDLYWTLFRKN